VSETQRAYTSRNEPGRCASCGGLADYVISAPAIVSAGPSKDVAKRVIVDERQVHNTHGKRWRDAGTTGQAGGVGRKKIFT
ncbi:MAG: hypothetical protein ACRD2R_02920, partial [Terriglobales bacterium]